MKIGLLITKTHLLIVYTELAAVCALGVHECVRVRVCSVFARATKLDLVAAEGDTHGKNYLWLPGWLSFPFMYASS